MLEILSTAGGYRDPQTAEVIFKLIDRAAEFAPSEDLVNQAREKEFERLTTYLLFVSRTQDDMTSRIAKNSQDIMGALEGLFGGEM
jgi:hypothetical protein